MATATRDGVASPRASLLLMAWARISDTSGYTASGNRTITSSVRRSRSVSRISLP